MFATLNVYFIVQVHNVFHPSVEDFQRYVNSQSFYGNAQNVFLPANTGQRIGKTGTGVFLPASTPTGTGNSGRKRKAQTSHHQRRSNTNHGGTANSSRNKRGGFS